MQLKQQLLRGLLSLFVVLVISTSVSASTEQVKATVDPNLAFRLESDTAYPGCLSPTGDSLVNLPFSVRKTNASNDRIIDLTAKVVFDPAILSLSAVEWNTTCWPFDNSSSVINGTTYDTLSLHFWCDDYPTDTGVLLTTDWSEYATVVFGFTCDSLAMSSEVAFSTDADHNEVFILGTTQRSAGSTGSGYAYTLPLEMTISISDTALVASYGDTIDVPLYLETNYLTNYYGLVLVRFDTTKLAYAGDLYYYFGGGSGATLTELYDDSTVRSSGYCNSPLCYTPAVQVGLLRFITKCELYSDSAQMDILESLSEVVMPEGLDTTLIFSDGTIASTNTEACDAVDPYLTFALGSDTAMPWGLTPDGDSLVVIPFDINQGDSSCSVEISSIHARVMYDAQSLQFKSVVPNDTAWPYEFHFDTVLAGVASYVDLEFATDSGESIEACSLSATFARITFLMTCNLIDSSMVSFVDSTGHYFNQVMHVGSSTLYEPTLLSDGLVHKTPTTAIMGIMDDTLYGPIGDTVDIPLILQANFEALEYVDTIAFDTSMLAYVGVVSDSLAVSASSSGDVVVVHVEHDDYGLPVYTPNGELVKLRFATKCGLWNSSTELVPGCLTLLTDCTPMQSPTITGDAGTITHRQTASLWAEYAHTAPVGKAAEEDLWWDIMVTTPIAVGNDAVDFDSTEGIVINVNLKSDMDFEDPPDSIHDSIDMYYNDYSGDKLCLYQLYDPQLSNVIDAGDSIRIVRINAKTGSAGFASTPTWENPYISSAADLPHFVDSNDAAVAHTALPYPGCGGEVNGPDNSLVYGNFDPIPAAVCLFFNEGDASYRGNETIDIFARSKVDFDSIAVTITVAHIDDRISVSDTSSGVRSTQLSNRSIKLYTNSAFGTKSANDSVLLARVALTRGWMTPGGAGIPLIYSSMDAYRSGGGQIFTDSTYYSVSAYERWKDVDNSGLPTTFALHQNFPNPFNPATTISLDLPEASDWTIEIYNILGQEVKRFEGYSAAGTVSVQWDASAHASGVYLYRATAGTYRENRKMLLLK